MSLQSDLFTPFTENPFLKSFQFAPVGMGILHPNGAVFQVNRSLCSLCGYTEEEWMNLRLQEVIHPGDRHSYDEAVTAAAEHHAAPTSFRARLLKKDGNMAEAELSVHMECDSSNQPLYVLFYARSLDASKTAERNIQACDGDRSLFLHNPAMILSIDLNGRITTANKAAECITGYKDGALIGLDCRHLLDEGFDTLLDVYKDTPLEQPVAYEVRIRRSNGNVIELGIKNVPIIIDGRVTGLYVIGRDITEAKRNRMLKDEAEQELRETVRNQQGLIFKYKEIDGEFVHTLCDGELLYRMESSPENVVGKTLHELFPPATATEKLDCYTRAWAGEEVSYEGKWGDMWYLACLRPIRKHGVVTEVIASCVDITERKRAERELVEAKEQIEALFHGSPSAIDLLDKEGNVIRVNPAHESLYGWKNDELKGKPLPVYPDHRRDDYRLLVDQVTAGKPVVDFETERIRKDGTLLTVSLTVSALRDKDGRIFGFTGVARDITESKKTEELLRKADRLNVVGQLAAGLAHEIRNPLTSLRGFLQLLRQGHREKDAFYELMLSELDRINTILGELLIIAKPQVTHFERKNLVQMLRDVQNLLMPQAALQSIQIRGMFETEHIPVRCSEGELKQVFINIMKNGMEAMSEGGILSVDLMFSGQDDVIVRISDQGVGIPEDRLPRLGEPFYTTKEKGTGLGLMMCYKIIQAHRGSIAITSKINVGTTVEIVLPLTPHDTLPQPQ